MAGISCLTPERLNAHLCEQVKQIVTHLKLNERDKAGQIFEKQISFYIQEGMVDAMTFQKVAVAIYSVVGYSALENAQHVEEFAQTYFPGFTPTIKYDVIKNPSPKMPVQQPKPQFKPIADCVNEQPKTRSATSFLKRPKPLAFDLRAFSKGNDAFPDEYVEKDSPDALSLLKIGHGHRSLNGSPVQELAPTMEDVSTLPVFEFRPAPNVVLPQDDENNDPDLAAAIAASLQPAPAQKARPDRKDNGSPMPGLIPLEGRELPAGYKVASPEEAALLAAFQAGDKDLAEALLKSLGPRNDNGPD